MNLYRCMRSQSLPLNVAIILCLWILVGGLAWADSFDLTDDVGIPRACAGVMIDADEDEVREKLDQAIRTAGSLFEHLPPATLSHLLPALSSRQSVAPSRDPLYQRLRMLRL